MAKIESYAPGSFVWSELASTDPAAAKKFYGEMFGWTYVDAPMPMGVYTIFMADGNEARRALSGASGHAAQLGVCFSAHDLDADSAKIAGLGGEIVMGPQDIGEPGRLTLREKRSAGRVFQPSGRRRARSVRRAAAHLGR